MDYGLVSLLDFVVLVCLSAVTVQLGLASVQDSAYAQLK
jgi:hypothetical protein